jgi:hypothetical protein
MASRMSAGSAEAPPAELTNVLESNERLIWWDRPHRGIVFRPADAFLIPFSLVWVSMPGVGVISMLRGGATSPTPFSLVPVLFVAIGLYLLIGRFFYDAWRRARTVYGLTNSRVLIVQPWKYKSLDLAGISEINLQLRRSGRGSIVFGPEYGVFDRRGNSGWGGAPAVPTFELIDEAAQVHAAIRNAQKRLRASTAT